jgi:hypothetical protein
MPAKISPFLTAFGATAFRTPTTAAVRARGKQALVWNGPHDCLRALRD